MRMRFETVWDIDEVIVAMLGAPQRLNQRFRLLAKVVAARIDLRLFGSGSSAESLACVFAGDDEVERCGGQRADAWMMMLMLEAGSEKRLHRRRVEGRQERLDEVLPHHLQ